MPAFRARSALRRRGRRYSDHRGASRFGPRPHRDRGPPRRRSLCAERAQDLGHPWHGRIGRAALSLASDYARKRVVASQSLADSSLVQHGYSSLWARCEATRLLCFRVAANLAASDATAMASAAKAMAGELALDACRWAS